MFRINCWPAVLMFQHQTRPWAHLYSSHTRTWHKAAHGLHTHLFPRAGVHSNPFGHSSLNSSAQVVLSCSVPAGAVISYHHGPGAHSHSPGPWHTPRWPCGTGWCSQPSSAHSDPAHTAGTLLSPPSADSHLCWPCQQFQRDRPLLSSHLGGKVWDRTERPFPPDFRFPILQMLLLQSA